MERTSQLMVGSDVTFTTSYEVHHSDPEHNVLFGTISDAIDSEINYTINNSLLITTTETYDVFLGYPYELLRFGAICFIAFAILGVLGNFISIMALSKSKRLRNATTAFIVNLCSADLLFCGVTMPLSAIQFLKGKGYLSEALCKLFPLIQYSNAFVSLFSVIAITVNRYILVVHPRFYPSVYTKRNIAIMIAFSWLLPIMLLMLPLLEIWGKMGDDPKLIICSIVKVNGTSPKPFFHVTAFGIPSVIFIACYVRIFCAVKKASRRANRHVENPKNCAPLRDRKELRVLRVMLVIFILFFVCYFPATFINIFYKKTDIKYLNVLGYLGVYFTNIVNPVVYIAMSKEYRNAYKEIFCRRNVISQTDANC